jgi:hypothetical protein
MLFFFILYGFTAAPQTVERKLMTFLCIVDESSHLSMLKVAASSHWSVEERQPKTLPATRLWTEAIVKSARMMTEYFLRAQSLSNVCSILRHPFQPYALLERMSQTPPMYSMCIVIVPLPDKRDSGIEYSGMKGVERATRGWQTFRSWRVRRGRKIRQRAF